VPDLPRGLADAVAGDWADDVGGYPLWVVKAACDHYRRTEGKRAPRPADIIALCKEETEPERHQLYEIEIALAVLPPEPEPDRITPEQAAAVLEKSGVRKDLDEAEARAKAERPRTEASKHMQERTNIAAMETLNRQRAEASGG